MPPLLQSAQLKPDVTITSADSDDDIDESDDERFVLNKILLILHKRFLINLLQYTDVLFLFHVHLTFLALTSYVACLAEFDLEQCRCFAFKLSLLPCDYVFFFLTLSRYYQILFDNIFVSP